MDAIQLRFMALVLRLFIVLVYRTGTGETPTVNELLHTANDMIIFLDARARAVS